MGPSVIADLDTLLIALYVELTDRIIPARSRGRRRGPGRPPAVTDAEVVCLAVAQVLLRYNDERHWLRAAPSRVGHLFPRLLSQPVYNRRLRATAWLLEAALRWLADHTPATTELLRLLDGTPVVCGRSRTTAVRSDLAGWAGYGHDTSHHCFYWGSRLLLVTTPDGTVTGFGLANPKLMGEREAVVGMLAMVPANRPAPGTLLVGDKGFAGRDFQAALASLDLAIVRPARAGELDPGSFPNWLRQRVEAIIWTLKHQLGLDRHGGRIPAGLWTRVVQRLLALNAVVWFNWQIDAPVKRSLIAYDHSQPSHQQRKPHQRSRMNSPPSAVSARASAASFSSASDTPSQLGEPPANVSSSSEAKCRYARIPSRPEVRTPTSWALSSITMRWAPNLTT